MPKARTHTHSRDESVDVDPGPFYPAAVQWEREAPENCMPSTVMQAGSHPGPTSNHSLTSTVTALQRTEERQFGVTTSTRGYIHILATCR